MKQNLEIFAFASSSSLVRELESYLSKELINEITQFIERNKIVETDSVVSSKECCPNCLKAHIKYKLKKIKMPLKDKTNMLNILDGDIGHSGYYLDEEKLIKLD
jgi:hypothetical protein